MRFLTVALITQESSVHSISQLPPQKLAHLAKCLLLSLAYMWTLLWYYRIKRESRAAVLPVTILDDRLISTYIHVYNLRSMIHSLEIFQITSLKLIPITNGGSMSDMLEIYFKNFYHMNYGICVWVSPESQKRHNGAGCVHHCRERKVSSCRPKAGCYRTDRCETLTRSFTLWTRRMRNFAVQLMCALLAALWIQYTSGWRRL